MNRIKKARQLKKVSQKELADYLNITQQAISYYENGKRIPDEKILSDIAFFLDVSWAYLNNETDDIDGWDAWEGYTGISVDEIKSEIKRMEQNNHLSPYPEKLQSMIGQAVANLNGIGNTNKGIIRKITQKLSEASKELEKSYFDPKKLEILAKKGEIKKEGSSYIFPVNIDVKKIIYDDLSDNAYKEAKSILNETYSKIMKLSHKYQ
ncbi:hypothetical protein IGK74_000552 [Enterococcus sp. AZ150]|uniref:helix-turn-helix domain-containing protein n=1 Tax=Enterococcus sp. AZ150 TaxID=2774866 RepID=UPI003F272A29